MIRWLSVFLLILSLTPVLAQSSRIDSLRAVLAKHPQADTFRVNRLYDLAVALHNTPTPGALAAEDTLFDKTLALARQLKYPYGQARALHQSARLKSLRQANASLQLLAQALAFANLLKNKALIADIQISTGFIYMYAIHDQGHLNQALPYFQRAYAVAKATGLPDLLDQSMNLIGTCYYQQHNYEQALNWFFQRLRFAEKIHLTKAEGSALRGIGNVYSMLTDYEQALPYFQKALT